MNIPTYKTLTEYFEDCRDKNTRPNKNHQCEQEYFFFDDGRPSFHLCADDEEKTRLRLAIGWGKAYNQLAKTLSSRDRIELSCDCIGSASLAVEYNGGTYCRHHLPVQFYQYKDEQKN